jgi:hypothetical protein
MLHEDERLAATADVECVLTHCAQVVFPRRNKRPAQTDDAWLHALLSPGRPRFPRRAFLSTKG